MKKILLLCLIVIPFSYCKAQVSYGDRTWGNYNMKINLITEEDSIFLNIVYTDENKKLSDSPKLLMRLMDDSVISLDGTLLDSRSKSDGGAVIMGILFESNYFVSEAKFSISKAQVENLSKGVKKLRLNTSPKYHEKEWKKDKIGRVLYEKYKESSSNSFEDGF